MDDVDDDELPIVLVEPVVVDFAEASGVALVLVVPTRKLWNLNCCCC